MEKSRQNYPDIAPSGPTFSRGVRAENLLFVAGCTARGTDAQGKGLMEQLRVTLDRIIRIVAAEGGAPGDIVKITTFVTSVPDWNAHDEENQALFNEFFQGRVSGEHAGGDWGLGRAGPGRGDRSNREVGLAKGIAEAP